MSNKIHRLLYTRPRVLNVLHALGLSTPHSQMTLEEMACLKKHALNKNLGLEIGTYMGVSATIISSVMNPTGKLFCVDPFERKKGKDNPGFVMAKRELKRKKVLKKVVFLRGYSTDISIKAQIPDELDFIFIDGDHSYEGLRNDWGIVIEKLKKGGVVCLHDTTTPMEEPYRNFGSVTFYNETIIKNSNFNFIENCYSMNVLLRNS